MALDIGTTASFTTGNMKPETGDQADSLWGQNIADNTGYLYYQPKQVHVPVNGFDLQFSENTATDNTYVGTFYGETLRDSRLATIGTFTAQRDTSSFYDYVPAHHNRLDGTWFYSLTNNTRTDGTFIMWYDGTRMGTIVGGQTTTSAGVVSWSFPIGTGARFVPVQFTYEYHLRGNGLKTGTFTVNQFRFSTRRA